VAHSIDLVDRQAVEQNPTDLFHRSGRESCERLGSCSLAWLSSRRDRSAKGGKRGAVGVPRVRCHVSRWWCAVTLQVTDSGSPLRPSMDHIEAEDSAVVEGGIGEMEPDNPYFCPTWQRSYLAKGAARAPSH
jgi:hypothetical protein